jgi:CrcB protein
MLKNILWIGLGGGIGSILRYLVSLFILNFFHGQSLLGTFIVNILGCFLAGLLCSVCEANLNPTLRLFLIVGFCGGFTTFSTFALDNIALWQAAAYFKTMLYAALSIVVGFAAAWLGMAVVK